MSRSRDGRMAGDSLEKSPQRLATLRRSTRGPSARPSARAHRLRHSSRGARHSRAPAYFDEVWRETITLRGIDRLALNLTSYPANAPAAVRPDWRPSSGRPGSDLDLLRHQALDAFGSRFAICNVLRCRCRQRGHPGRGPEQRRTPQAARQALPEQAVGPMLEAHANPGRSLHRRACCSFPSAHRCTARR
jgi:hypothetical protein